MEITQPGVYRLAEHDYHADPVPGGSMSSTTARHILPPAGCPALVRWEAENPVRKAAYDLGSVWHALTLGAGPEIVEVEAADWRTNAAKKARDDARAAGAVPILSGDLATVRAMVAAVHANTRARQLLADGTGEPELSVVWQDKVWRRAMLDWFPNADAPGLPIAVDLKSTTSVEPSALERTIWEYGYHQQAAWYLDGLASTGMQAAFAFIFVQKKPPHLVSVVQLDDEAIAIGRRRNQTAVDVWARCRETGEWPAYTTDITTIGLPRWAAAREDTY